MWTIRPTDEYNKRVRAFRKKASKAVFSLNRKLQSVKTVLEASGNADQVNYAFFKKLRPRLHEIKSSVAGQTPLRLYVFLQKTTKTIHLLTIGDKRTQDADIKAAHEAIKRIKEE